MSFSSAPENENKRAEKCINNNKIKKNMFHAIKKLINNTYLSYIRSFMLYFADDVDSDSNSSAPENVNVIEHDPSTSGSDDDVNDEMFDDDNHDDPGFDDDVLFELSDVSSGPWI